MWNYIRALILFAIGVYGSLELTSQLPIIHRVSALLLGIVAGMSITAIFLLKGKNENG